MRHVIIGNGIAGIQAAESIRRLDHDASLTLIAGETFPPYCRPMISHILEGRASADRLPIRPPDFYEVWKIQPFVGETVTNIDVDRRDVVTDTGNSIPFDRLLIASGADPRPVNAKGLELKNIFFMRTEAHVRQMLDVLPGAKRALVLGGGLVGFKAACGLMQRGLKVTMLIRSQYPLSMQVDPVAGEMIRKELMRQGLEVRVGIEVTSFQGNGEITEAHLSDGTTVPCDIAVIGKGVRPATSFVPRNKIKVDLGIMIDDHMETNIPGIYAAGDVAESMDIARRQRWVNALWPVAAEQGRIAGMNMAGRRVSYKGSLGRNIIRIFGMDVLSAGLINPPDNDIGKQKE